MIRPRVKAVYSWLFVSLVKVSDECLGRDTRPAGSQRGCLEVIYMYFNHSSRELRGSRPKGQLPATFSQTDSLGVAAERGDVYAKVASDTGLWYHRHCAGNNSPLRVSQTGAFLLVFNSIDTLSSSAMVIVDVKSLLGVWVWVMVVYSDAGSLSVRGV